VVRSATMGASAQPPLEDVAVRVDEAGEQGAAGQVIDRYGQGRRLCAWQQAQRAPILGEDQTIPPVRRRGRDDDSGQEDARRGRAIDIQHS